MKSYNEMAKSALLRIDEENKIILRRKKALKRTLIPTLCLCLAVAVSFTVKEVLDNKKGAEIEKEYVLYEGIVENAIGTVDQDAGNAANGNSAKPDNSNGNAPTNNQTTSSSYTYIIDIIYEGKIYSYSESEEDLSHYEKDEFLGDTTDFVGYLKPQYTEGKVYTVKGSFEILLVELEDGERVLLKEVN